MTFKVLVADNFHYGDNDETYCGGEFKTLDNAIQFCKSNVDDYLDSAYEKGMSEEALFSSYSSFGDDPYIVSDNTVSDNFSAWDYARGRCKEICSQDATTTSQVIVKFSHITEYWLSMEISIFSNGVQINQVTCEISAIFCPFKSLMAWLESVVNDTKDTSFYWDAEGPEGMIGFNSSQLYVQWPCATDLAESQILCEVNKKQVIKAFYEGFSSFVKSEDYKPELYEAISLGEELAMKSYTGFTQEEIVGVLLTLSSKQVNAKLNSIRRFSPGLFYRALGNKIAYAENKSYLTKEWDSFNIYEKRKLLKTKLKDKKTIGSKTKIRKLRSKLIEEWISK